MKAVKQVARLQGGVYVLQRRAAPVVGVIAAMGIAIMAIVVFPVAIPKNSAFDMLFLGGFLMGAMRVIWRVLVRPRIQIRDGYFEVFDVVWRWVIPFHSIRRIDSGEGLTIFLDDNQQLSVFAFSASLIDRGRTCEAAKREMRKAMHGKKKATVVPGKQEKRLDWTWVDLALAPFPILLIWGILFER